MNKLSIAACLSLACLAPAAVRPAAPATAHRAGSRGEVHTSKSPGKGRVSARSKGAGTSSTQSRSAHRRVRRRRHYYRRVRLPKSPTPERISQIQSALSHGGYYHGDTNGKWDGNTVDALRNFQSANNIDATGKLDAPTLQKLGLGSDIAGVSAPKPIAPGCCSTPASASAPSIGASTPDSPSSSQRAAPPATATGTSSPAGGTSGGNTSKPGPSHP